MTKREDSMRESDTQKTHSTPPYSVAGGQIVRGDRFVGALAAVDRLNELEEQLEATQRILVEERRWREELSQLLETFADRSREVKLALTASGVRPDLRDDLISVLADYEQVVPNPASEPKEGA